MYSFLQFFQKKESAVDIEKIGDQISYSFEKSRFDFKLFSSFLTQEVFLPSYLSFVKQCLELKEDDLISLSTEIGIMKDYLKITKEQNQDNFFYSIAIKGLEDDINDVKIPSFILFPLLQNAIHNGYNSMEKYPMRIRIQCSSSLVKFEVSNRVNHYLDNQEINNEIRWFKSRLQHYYADRYSLIFNSNSSLFKATLMLQF